MTAPTAVKNLIDTFHRNRDAYRSPAYNETQLRHEFLDPFFMALGWDVKNTAGYAEAYKDVIHEDSLKINAFDWPNEFHQVFGMGDARLGTSKSAKGRKSNSRAARTSTPAPKNCIVRNHLDRTEAPRLPIQRIANGMTGWSNSSSACSICTKPSPPPKPPTKKPLSKDKSIPLTNKSIAWYMNYMN